MRHCLMFGDGCAVGLIDLKGAKLTYLRVCVTHNSNELTILPLTCNRETEVQVKDLTA